MRVTLFQCLMFETLRQEKLEGAMLTFKTIHIATLHQQPCDIVQKTDSVDLKSPFELLFTCQYICYISAAHEPKNKRGFATD